MNLDARWYLDINSFARSTHWLHGVLAAYALWGGLVVLAAVFLGTYWFVARARPDGPRWVGLMVLGGGGALVALGANQLIGHAVGRVRPCHALPHVETLLACANDASFPSDHAMIAGALVAILIIVDRRVGLAGLVLALLLAFARVYAGVHYPGDVASGLVIGAAIDLVVVVALRPVATWAAGALAQTGLRPLLATSPPERVPGEQPGGSGLSPPRR
jgi:membrane-associated phospholipid phosphatase